MPLGEKHKGGSNLHTPGSAAITSSLKFYGQLRACAIGRATQDRLKPTRVPVLAHPDVRTIPPMCKQFARGVLPSEGVRTPLTQHLPSYTPLSPIPLVPKQPRPCHDPARPSDSLAPAPGGRWGAGGPRPGWGRGGPRAPCVQDHPIWHHKPFSRHPALRGGPC